MNNFNSLILCCVFMFAFANISMAQLMIDSHPDPLWLECSTQSDHNNEIQNWIDNFLASASATTSCSSGSNITWSHDWSGSVPANIQCYYDVFITFTATDDCGDQDYISADVSIQDFVEPEMTIPASTLFTLVCDGNNNVNDINALIANNWNHVLFPDECSGEEGRLSYHPPHLETDLANNGIQCGEEINFELEYADDCGNMTQSFITIQAVATQVGFINNGAIKNENHNNPNITICVSIQDPNISASTDVEISISPNSTATNGVDYTALADVFSLSFPAGSEANQCFNVSLIDDQLAEINETIIFEITDVSGGSNVIVSENDAFTVSIGDDDDNDDDGISNLIDNCPQAYNPFQEDIDNDGIGNVCDNSNEPGQLSTIESNIFLDVPYSGVIVRSPNGTCWQIVVNDSGVVETVAVVCPD